MSAVSRTLLAAATIGSLGCGIASGPALSPDQQALARLMNDYYAELQSYWSEKRQFTNLQEYEQALRSGERVDPNAEYIPRLLAFEAEHRGGEVGLLALWHVLKEAGRGGQQDAPAVVGRREAVERLESYAESRLFYRVTETAFSGNYDQAVRDSLDSLVESLPLSSNNAAFLRLHLANNALSIRDARAATELGLKRLVERTDVPEPSVIERYRTWLADCPTADDLESRCVAAIDTLETLAADPDSPRVPGVEGIDEKWRVIRPIDDPDQPLLSERATAVLFEERHLRLGAEAPDLEVTLLDGKAWRMADQRGKVVVVQLSFTGCGPCERMYPDLADLAAKHGDSLSVLTLMRDAEPDSARAGVASGKLTWNIAMDGDPGVIATRWSVDGFPEVYVIDRKGKIAAEGLRGDELRAEIDRLQGNDG